MEEIFSLQLSGKNKEGSNAGGAGLSGGLGKNTEFSRLRLQEGFRRSRAEQLSEATAA